MSKGFVFDQPKLLKELTTFEIGGPCKHYLEIRTISEAQEAIKFCHQKKLPWMVLGKGSNCLFDDKGFNGVILHSKIDFIKTPHEGTFYVGSGYSFSLLGSQTARKGWSGLEFASGIPGSVGGAIFMNAGANGRETCESLICVEFVDHEGNLHNYPISDLCFAYRSSSFQKRQGMIVSGTFALNPSPCARPSQLEIINYRKNTQPYDSPSAGCVFRNPLNNHSGALIEKAGLKGLSVGDASVSEKHANFIINKHQASSEDVLKLIRIIQERVKETTGIELESEIRYFPYQEDACE